MTDAPPPPPPPPETPPGYAAYTESNWSSGLKRIKSTALTIQILLAVVIIGTLISLATVGGITDKAQDLVDAVEAESGIAAAEEAFEDQLTGSGLAGMLAGAAGIALIVMSIIWLYRIVKNHVAIRRQVRWAPGWAIGGWFAPPLLFIIPTLVLRESWTIANSDPSKPANDNDTAGENPWIWVWFVLYSLAPLVLMALGVSQFTALTNTDTVDLAEYYTDESAMITAQSVLSILGAGAWAMVVRTLSAKHMDYTGESSAR